MVKLLIFLAFVGSVFIFFVVIEFYCVKKTKKYGTRTRKRHYALEL